MKVLYEIGKKIIICRVFKGGISLNKYIFICSS